MLISSSVRIVFASLCFLVLDTLQVAAQEVVVEGKVMLVHEATWPPKMLGLVSGFLEASEHPDAAMAREIKEETNLAFPVS